MTESETDAATAVRAHVDAFNAHDLENLVAGFTEDALWITGATVIRGIDDLTRFFSDAMTGLLPTLTIENLIATGDRVACELTETLTANGEERTFSIAGFYRVHEGFIAAAKIYREGSAELA